MAFTQQDMERQMAEFAALQEEFSRLEAEEKAQLKALGLTEKDLGKPDLDNLPPELKKMVDEARDVARRAGEARKTQSGAAARPSSGPRPGAGRRGVVRL